MYKVKLKNQKNTLPQKKIAMNYGNNGERVNTKKAFSDVYKVKLKNQKKHSTSKKIAISYGNNGERVKTKKFFFPTCTK